jgi:hypothetical protein
MSMDAVAAKKPVKINRWLPYWAVFQADVRQTLRSWVYRTWVLMSVLAAVGYLLFLVGAHRLAGLRMADSVFISDVLRWMVIGSVTLIIVLTVGTISSERGTMADSVLSRGISRYQYFLGKWHARLATVLGSFFVMSALWLTAGFFLLTQELQLDGALVALLTVASFLAAVISFGVTVSAFSNSTVLGIAILWMALYGAGFMLSLMPDRLPSPDRVLQRLPNILKGFYDLSAIGQVVMWSLILSLISAAVGMTYFARRDV